MGTGIIRILKSYDKKSFEFFPNFIRVTFPFNKNDFQNQKSGINNMLSETQNAIIKLIKEEPSITQNKLANLLNVNTRTIQRNIKELVDMKIVERKGPTKKGIWIIKQ